MKVLGFIITLTIAISSFAQSATTESPACPIQNHDVSSPHDMMNKVTTLSVVGKRPGETLPWNYEPPKLEAIPYQYLNPNFSTAMQQENEFEYMRADALSAMVAMIEEARREGIKLFAHSAYRPYKIQCQVFSLKVRKELEGQPMSLDQAIASVNTRSALPGQSEHQLGTVVDFVTDIPNIGYKLEYEMQNTPAFQWLKAHASKFGFVMSFPAAQMMDFRKPNPHTGYIYEPWHWRYIHPHYSTRFEKCVGKINKMTSQYFLKAVSANQNYQCN